MDDSEALLQLYAGTASERDGALAFLFDRYYARLVQVIMSDYRLDAQSAYVGAADALRELHEDAPALVPKLEGKSEQPWRWLLQRAVSRTRDERRRNRRILTGVPKSEQQDLTRHEYYDDDSQGPATVVRDNNDPHTTVADAETVERISNALVEFLESIDGVDRGILLHDMVFQYDVLSERDAAEFDEELIGTFHPDGLYTDEALKKRRQRLTAKLRTFLRSRDWQ